MNTQDRLLQALRDAPIHEDLRSIMLDAQRGFGYFHDFEIRSSRVLLGIALLGSLISWIAGDVSGAILGGTLLVLSWQFSRWAQESQAIITAAQEYLTKLDNQNAIGESQSKCVS